MSQQFNPLTKIHTDTDYRVILCETCGSEGRIHEPYDRALRIPGRPCPDCEGTGGEVIEVQPIEMPDLDRATGLPFGRARR